MEPHSYECGNERILSGRYFIYSASMEPHSYECGNLASAVMREVSSFRFNGAALLRVRKWLKASPLLMMVLMLQWSRTLTSAEIIRRYSSVFFFFLLQWSRTLTSAEIPTSIGLRPKTAASFNGAALLRVRKCCPSEYLISQGFGKG